MDELQVGDTVVLKCRHGVGPRMSVYSISAAGVTSATTKYRCVWFSTADEPQEADFPREVLLKVIDD